MKRERTLQATTHCLFAVRVELVNLMADRGQNDGVRKKCEDILRRYILPAMNEVDLMQEADVHRFGSQRRTDMKHEMQDMREVGEVRQKQIMTVDLQDQYVGYGGRRLSEDDVEAEKGAMP